ncbi:MAG TPA: cupin domain-containing protein [Azospirillaceae bacterium]|nr:cupin domain-containing protein [Azospirillaceae bacterium]
MTKGIASIIVFGSASPEEQVYRPDANRILGGSPDQRVWNHYADDSGQFAAGIWEGAPGQWRVNFTEHEFCHLLSGRVIVRDDAGQQAEFKAGDSFVMPAGFTGSWEVVETARKLYAVFEPAATAR